MLSIIPQPNYITLTDKPAFDVSSLTKVHGDSVLTALFGQETMKIINSNEKNNFEFSDTLKDTASTISLSINKALEQEEYQLTIDSDTMSIVGGSVKGVFYALQTLKQIILQKGSLLPTLIIKDKPLYEYRGFMLDVGRYFYSVQDVKHLIDMSALHKLNVFHWHLTEDQGWRISIKGYPNLTKIGSKRRKTNFNMIPHKGYYTQDDVREIVAYAKAKQMIVIPEIDMPGHMVSAIASYSYLSCFDRKIKVATHWGVKHDILCAGKDSSYKFIHDVLDEIIALFPDKYIHIGGDEAVKTRWKLCPHCQQKIRELNLPSEDALQYHFMSVISKYLKEHGKTAVMWNPDNPIYANNMDSDIVWQYWTQSPALDNMMLEQLANGRKIINSISSYYYLDLPYAKNNLEKVYNGAPELDKNNTIFGIEAALWTEYVPTLKKAHYMSFPRLSAIAEIAWSAKQDRNYDNFIDKLTSFNAVLDYYNVDYALPSRYNPKRITALFSKLWFGRRYFHWQGLHNLIENAIIKWQKNK